MHVFFIVEKDEHVNNEYYLPPVLSSEIWPWLPKYSLNIREETITHMHKFL